MVEIPLDLESQEPLYLHYRNLHFEAQEMCLMLFESSAIEKSETYAMSETNPVNTTMHTLVTN